jgi:hypothetical protein
LLSGCDNYNLSFKEFYEGKTDDVPLASTKKITVFSFASPAATGTVDEAAKTIAVTVPYGTDLTGLVPTVTHTGVSISPALDAAQGFSNPVIYTVTAADGSTAIYTVTVDNTSLTSTGDIAAYLDPASGGTSASDPVVLPPLTLDLASDWTKHPHHDTGRGQIRGPGPFGLRHNRHDRYTGGV